MDKHYLWALCRKDNNDEFLRYFVSPDLQKVGDELLRVLQNPDEPKDYFIIPCIAYAPSIKKNKSIEKIVEELRENITKDLTEIFEEAQKSS